MSQLKIIIMVLGYNSSLPHTLILCSNLEGTSKFKQVSNFYLLWPQKSVRQDYSVLNSGNYFYELKSIKGKYFLEIIRQLYKLRENQFLMTWVNYDNVCRGNEILQYPTNFTLISQVHD